MARILVIEDEAVLLSAMLRGLSKLPDVEVVGAESLEEALPLIDERQADIVLSDLCLPGRSGLELLGELSARGHATPVVFISAYVEAFGASIPRHKNVRVLEKPIEPDELRTLVSEILGWDSLGSDIPPFGVVDYLQLAGMGRHSVSLDVVAADADAGGRGRVVVVNGGLWAAEDELGAGSEAFTRLVNLPAATVDCRALVGEPGEQNIDGSWEELVLDAARIADESAAFGSGDEELCLETELPGQDGALLELAPSEPEMDFEKALAQGLEALLAKDYALAFEAFIAARSVHPDDKLVEASLARLADLGFESDMTEEP